MRIRHFPESLQRVPLPLREKKRERKPETAGNPRQENLLKRKRHNPLISIIYMN